MTAPLKLGAVEAGTGQKTFGHIPVALPEGGQVGVACQMVRRREDGPVLYVLRALGMVDGEPTLAEPPVYTTEELVDVRVPHAGMFLPRVKPEARVSEGQKIGVLVALEAFGEQEVVAPVKGVVQRIGAVSANCDVALPPMMPVAAEGGLVARLLPRWERRGSRGIG